jgi:hypothetical protein
MLREMSTIKFAHTVQLFFLEENLPKNFAEFPVALRILPRKLVAAHLQIAERGEHLKNGGVVQRPRPPNELTGPSKTQASWISTPAGTCSALHDIFETDFHFANLKVCVSKHTLAKTLVLEVRDCMCEKNT